VEAFAAEQQLWTIRIITVLISLEFAWAILSRTKCYSIRETITSITAIGLQRLLRVLSAYIVVPLSVLCYQYRLFDLEPKSVVYWTLLFLGVEFQYYWNHRLSHQIPWLWATHEVHHSVTEINVLTSLRVGATSVISGNFLFSLPLAWIGFSPISISIMFAFNLLYQSWLHTEFIGKLGMVDRLLNTPANHRVHHSRRSGDLDKNFGGILIIFDVMFGTYRAEKERHRDYGLVGVEPSANPFYVIARPWLRLLDTASKAKPWHIPGVLFWPVDRPTPGERRSQLGLNEAAPSRSK
jgi:sterol desaturase/sphingolipid hydroxylase (fatty acid hydroxylase superfamily)